MATTTNFGWETPDDTDLVKDGALAMRTLGNAIDTSLVDLKGGTTGQILSKTSNTNMDFIWIIIINCYFVIFFYYFTFSEDPPFSIKKFN